MDQPNQQLSPESEEKRNKASILFKLILAAWGVLLFVMFTALYSNDWQLVAGSLAGCALIIAPFALLRRGNLNASSLIIALIMICILTLLSTIGQGIRDLAIIAFPIIFIFAGLTLSRLLFRLYVSLAVAAVGWLSIGETYGWFIPKPISGENSNWLYLIIVTIILLMAALAVELLATNLQNNLANAKLEIEQRKLAEEEVEKREKRFQALIAHGRDNISLLAADGTLLWESPSAGNTLGYKPNHFMGSNIFELMHPDDQAWTQEMYAFIVQNPGNIREGEFRLLYADGTWRWIECSATNLLDEPGVHAVVLNYRDITERKAMEDAARASEERLATIFDMTGDVMFLLDVGQNGEYRFNTVNPAFLSTTGLSAEAVVGWSVKEVIPEPSLALALGKYRQAIQEKTIVRWEETSEYPTGKLTALITIAPVFDSNGICQLLVGNVHDITERKVAEEALQKSQDLYMNLVESQTDLICRWLPDTTVIYVNNAYCDYFGKSSEEIIGSRFKSWLPAETQNIVQDMVDRLLRREENRYISEEINISPQGSQRYVSWAYNPITNKNGEIIELQSVGRDITEKKQIEEALQENEIQYRNLADSGTALIWKSGTDKLCNYFNKPWLRFTGRTLEQEMGNGWAEGVHPDDFDLCLATYIAAFDKQETFDMDYRLRHSSGEYRWIQDLGSPNYNSNYEFVGYIGHCFDITERKRAEDQLRYQGTHDILTGIYNRTFFEEELARFERGREYPISIIIADVDGLKQVNDTRGHATGDELLKQAAEALGSVFRAEDVLARIGGDEFAILLPKTDFPSVENLVSRIRERLLENNKIHPDLQVHLSLGTSTAEKGDLVGTFTLADQRMYADKAARKATINHAFES